ncbi:hypothetical protein ACIA5C_27980 [Actinoplanes sp. NPDC051343]|uniref:hypothetical protein n=1 Tax=Actinoplanes sp. NPDC051343 TaxID=3363906 RepID=UPI0037A91B1D
MGHPAPPAGSYPPPGSYAPPEGYQAPPAGSYPPPSGWPGNPGAWPAGPVPPQKPKVSRAALIVTIVAIVVVLACLGFGTAVFFALRHDDSLDRAEGGPGTSPTAGPAGRATDEPGSPNDTHDGAIADYIIDAPAGTHPWAGARADEALDLTGAAANFADPSDGKLVLERYHFKDGYARRWVDDHGNYITVRVLRFASPGDGDNFTNFYIDANQGTGWGDPQPVPGLDTAAGFVQPKPAKSGFQRSLAVGDAGDIVAVVLADQAPPASATVPDTQLVDEFDLL